MQSKQGGAEDCDDERVVGGSQGAGPGGHYSYDSLSVADCADDSHVAQHSTTKARPRRRAAVVEGSGRPSVPVPTATSAAAAGVFVCLCVCVCVCSCVCVCACVCVWFTFVHVRKFPVKNC